jgi:hypothetical protein
VEGDGLLEDIKVLPTPRVVIPGFLQSVATVAGEQVAASDVAGADLPRRIVWFVWKSGPRLGKLCIMCDP